MVRNRYILVADLPLIAIAAFGAFALRFDWLFLQYRPEFTGFLAAALVLKPLVYFPFGMYQRYWRYGTTHDLLAIVMAVSAASVAMAVLVGVGRATGYLPEFARPVLMIDWLLTLALTGGLRMSVRVVGDARQTNQKPVAKQAKRALIVGAGAAGTMVAREMRRNPQIGMEPIGFLDDDIGKVGKHIGGLRVIGATRELPEIVRLNAVDNVVIAMPTVRGPAIRVILDMCHEARVKSQTIPGVFELLDGHVSVNRIRNVDIADLLRRNPVNGQGNVAGFVAGREVLVTGGGGSIGFELARQIANAAPSHLILLGHGENSIFDAEARMREAFPRVRLSSVIADIRDVERMALVFDRFRPAIVFHAAAHKHVPLMEENPEEAVLNNIIGTRNVVNQALRTASQRLVLVSTDKAVAPTSIMGATKRVAEAIVRQAARTSGRAFVAVRFGNVLGSRGSVVHTFKAQIEQGGPITITHPDMKRFFMTIPEAVHLVLQASGMGKGGELFVLDMGEPIRIVDLAQDIIKLSGLSEDEVPIVFTGVRPGEKLEEALFDVGSHCQPTAHSEVRQVAEPEMCTTVDLDSLVCQLETAARRGDVPTIGIILGQIIPGFVTQARVRATHDLTSVEGSTAGFSLPAVRGTIQ